jgi:integrase/recombinase XerD
MHLEPHIKENPLSDIKLLKDRRKVVETNEQLQMLFNQPNLRSFVGVRGITLLC